MGQIISFTTTETRALPYVVNIFLLTIPPAPPRWSSRERPSPLFNLRRASGKNKTRGCHGSNIRDNLSFCPGTCPSFGEEAGSSLPYDFFLFDPRLRMTRAGAPTATEYAGIVFTTTAPAPTTEPSSISAEYKTHVHFPR